MGGGGRGGVWVEDDLHPPLPLPEVFLEGHLTPLYAELDEGACTKKTRFSFKTFPKVS